MNFFRAQKVQRRPARANVYRFSRLSSASSTSYYARPNLSARKPEIVECGNLTRRVPALTLARLRMSDLFYSTISELAGRIRAKEISPVEIVTAHLERAQALHTKLNAFVHLDAEGALSQAQAAEIAARRGAALGPLHGVPVTVKSCIDVARWPCPAGSALRRDYVAQQDAVLVARLRAAGAILLGNTNTPEFLMAYETNNLLNGKTSNPWDLTRSAGGSSGGEAAAIASGCSVGGVGSDGGGSIRVPAHFCGICGLKPTPGRIPATGHFPAGGGAFSWLGVVGPMARTVSDVRALFEATAGPDAGDALSARVPLRAIPDLELKGLRVGLLESAALGKATPETQTALQNAANSLAAQGFSVEPLPLIGLERGVELWWFFFGAVIARLLRQSIAGREEAISPMLREYLSVAEGEIPEGNPAKGSAETTGGDFLTLDSFLAACCERDCV